VQDTAQDGKKRVDELQKAKSTVEDIKTTQQRGLQNKEEGNRLKIKRPCGTSSGEDGDRIFRKNELPFKRTESWNTEQPNKAERETGES